MGGQQPSQTTGLIDLSADNFSVALISDCELMKCSDLITYCPSHGNREQLQLQPNGQCKTSNNTTFQFSNIFLMACKYIIIINDIIVYHGVTESGVR